MATEARLHPDDLREMAELAGEIAAGIVVERLALLAGTSPMRSAETPAPGALVDVRTVARELGVSRDFVYSHAVELGGRKLTASPKAPWRFDLDEARAAHAERDEPSSSEPVAARRRRARSSAGGVQLLEIRGRST